MLRIDWRSPAAYIYVKRMPVAGFAWEYLRRNGDYLADFKTIARTKTPASEALDAFARRWGLRFPARSKRTA